MKSILFTKPKQLTLDCLRYLVEQGEELLGVILYDKEAYADSEFSAYCKANRLPLLDFSETGACFEAYKGEIDMVYCNTFPRHLKKEWIEAVNIAAINFHGAPLPDYQGVFGYNFAFLNGEKEFGVTCHFLAEQIDRGDIIEVLRFPYDFKSGSVKELVELSNQHMYKLFRKIYTRFKNGEMVLGTPQLGSGRYYSRQDFEREKEVRSKENEELVLRRIRAFWYPPYEGAYLRLGGKKVYLVPEAAYKDLTRQSSNGEQTPPPPRIFWECLTSRSGLHELCGEAA